MPKKAKANIAAGRRPKNGEVDTGFKKGQSKTAKAPSRKLK